MKDAEQERAEFDLYWLDRQRKRGFGQQLTDKEMLAYPERRADEFHAWQAARRAPAVTVPQANQEQIEHVKYWRDAYANPKGDEHFMGHGMVVKIIDDYLALLTAAPLPPEAAPAQTMPAVTKEGKSYERIFASPVPLEGQKPATLEEMAILVRKLVRALRKASPDNETARGAMDYLKRKGLQGSPFRTSEAE